MPRRSMWLVGLLASAALAVPATAHAADAWPDQKDYFSYLYETSAFLTPTDLDYWNPLVDQSRLTSPYGTSTRIVCSSWRGVTMDCWQADRDGNPHKLQALPMNFPVLFTDGRPGGGPKHFVYPLWTTGS